ncbi:hypothetical protein [Seonamhaeicola marinus]|uniref:Lipocalin-like domain-containing protein n=1 Tax=Seonamhaeicola marinus TaxID=1912246 RepID=A0A5D0IYY6_9FLAO|nr:hypothetical protein [Seonamhaeicola marinus]TYA89165.1 hypothetical protein FUA24_03235 [Seonamhaeicola marinus]
MKRSILIIGVFFLLISSCSLENDNSNEPTQITLKHWNLINVSGGVAGVDVDFNVGDIIWNYDQFNNLLYVENSNTDDTLIDGLDTGTYDFYLIESNSKVYTILDVNEFGEIYTSETDTTILTINQNNLSTGSITDGFVYTFKITTSVVEI